MGVVASGKNQTGRCSMKDVDADLQPCLQDVLNVFNEKDADGRVKLEEGKPVETKSYHVIMDELAAYANATNEQMRYVHFVKTSNMVLDALSSMEMPSSNSAPDKNPAMFMVNSPTRMYSVYKGKTYCQTPAILLGYKKHLQRVYPEASESVPIGDLVKDGPSQPFPWTQALLFVEMESFSEAVPAPPLAYTPRVLAECQSAARDEGRLDSTDSLSFTDNDSSTTAVSDFNDENVGFS
ncbi:hypothetical protein CPC08DRAFT_761806 [Agrocybe pediades]|nr:hypothetical protein CPC08DRAFT_761806 [Agrocybe pediades]